MIHLSNQILHRKLTNLQGCIFTRSLRFMLVQKVIEFAFLMHESCLYSEYSKLLLLLNPINCFYFTFIAEYSFRKFHSKSKVSKLDLSISNFMKSYHLLSFFKFMHLSFKKIYSFVFIFVSLQLIFRYIYF